MDAHSRTAEKPRSAEKCTRDPGFAFAWRITRPAREILAAFGEFDTPAISDQLDRLFTMATAIHELTDPGLRILGPACTIRVYPGDNLMVHKSLDVARPGDVLVVDASASTITAVSGDLVATKARHRRIAGMVVEGLIRDLPAIRALGDFPVFARGVTPPGPLHRGPGEVNNPISAGGVVVQPGDIIVGDPNGVVGVPREWAADTARETPIPARRRGELHRGCRAGRVLERLGRPDPRGRRGEPGRFRPIVVLDG